MAEIKIEKKQPIWPWILGIIIVAAAVYFLFFRETTAVVTDTTTNNDTIVETSEMQDNQNGDDSMMGVVGFVAFVKNDDGNMTLDHEYSQSALTKLIDATEEISSETNFDSKIDLDNARMYTNEISKNPEATSHADNIKKTTDMISKVLQNLQQSKFPALKAEADEARMSSQAITVKELTLNQKNKIKSFFDDAADLLEKMNKQKS